MSRLYSIFARVMAGTSLLICIIMGSCTEDRSEFLPGIWQMEDDSYSVEFKSDNTYTFRDGNNAITGEWTLSENGKELILTEGEYGERLIEVKKLNERKLVLDDNGTKMKFSKVNEHSNKTTQKK